MLKAMRPHQWSKNTLMFLPLLAAHDFAPMWQVILGFIAFCLTASTVYVINDLMDLSADRAHPRKKNRPFASGALSAGQGLVMALVLIGLAIVCGLMTGNGTFLIVLAGYFAITFAYSLWLKRKLIIDVLMLGGLYTVRIVAGGAAAFLRGDTAPDPAFPPILAGIRGQARNVTGPPDPVGRGGPSVTRSDP